MSPTILVRKADQKVRLVGGASGGPRIITGTAQVNIILFALFDTLLILLTLYLIFNNSSINIHRYC